MNEQEKYEKLRLHITQQIDDAKNIINSDSGEVEKLSKQLQIHFLYQILEKMNQLDNEHSNL